MSWDALAKLDIVCRPIENWPGVRTAADDLRHSRFDSTLASTLDTLRRELEALDATNIVLGLSITPNQIRNDGLPYASARLPDGAVLLGFDSTHGALRYACDLFKANHWRTNGSDWEHNLRAVALGLEALRKVDRYGIARDGQQYRGYAALPAPIAMGDGSTHLTSADAWALLFELVPGAEDGDWATTDKLIKAAKAAAHPDRHDGDRTLWDQVESAATVVSR